MRRSLQRQVCLDSLCQAAPTLLAMVCHHRPTVTPGISCLSVALTPNGSGDEKRSLYLDAADLSWEAAAIRWAAVWVASGTGLRRVDWKNQFGGKLTQLLLYQDEST